MWVEKDKQKNKNLKYSNFLKFKQCRLLRAHLEHSARSKKKKKKDNEGEWVEEAGTYISVRKYCIL